jgi:hypothetical protein
MEPVAVRAHLRDVHPRDGFVRGCIVRRAAT